MPCGSLWVLQAMQFHLGGSTSTHSLNDLKGSSFERSLE